MDPVRHFNLICESDLNGMFSKFFGRNIVLPSWISFMSTGPFVPYRCHNGLKQKVYKIGTQYDARTVENNLNET